MNNKSIQGMLEDRILTSFHLYLNVFLKLKFLKLKFLKLKFLKLKFLKLKFLKF